MSLDFLAELVSITNGAVKSLNNSGSTCTSENLRFYNAGSPFLSPQSFKSISDKSECHDNSKKDKDVSVKNSEPNKSSDTASSSNANGVKLTEHTTDSGGVELGNMIADTVTCKHVVEVETQPPNPDHYSENLNNSQKVSISKKHLREIISPRDDAPGYVPNLSQSKASSEDLENSRKNIVQSFPKASKSKRKYFVERHEPNTNGANMNNNRIVGREAETESVGSYDDQPDIIDVQEKAVVNTSGLSESSGDSVKSMQYKDGEACDSGRNSRDIYHKIILEENEPRHGLKQGALKNGFIDPTKASLFSDVYISQFGLTERQRDLKEALAKRSESNKPKKRLIQPHIVKRKGLDDDEADRPAINKQPDSLQAINSSVDPIVTAAAAASAAVAAAQPFLKTQVELEGRMQQLLVQLVELQQKQGGSHADNKSLGSDNRIQDLERQVAEISERRFEHLENMQQQQMQMQAQLLYMSQARPHNNRGYKPNTQTSPSRQFQNSHIPQAVAGRLGASSQNPDFLSYNQAAQNQPAYSRNVHKQPIFNPATLSQHHNYLSEVRELQGSHLDTPAPRDRVPKPLPYTLPKEPQKNLGFLQELLSDKDIDRDTTFSVKGDYSSPSRLASDWNNSSRVRRPDQSPVDKARQLVTSLSRLEKETADSLWDSSGSKAARMDVDLGPAPLDQYLKYPEKEGSPYPKLSHHSRKTKKMLHSMDNLLEAKKILRHFEVTRETLEANLDQVVRSQRDVHVFSTLLGSGSDSSGDDRLRIEKLVNKRISAMDGDVQREVLRSLAQSEADKLAAQQQLELAAKRTLDLARSGVLKGHTERNARLAYSKPNVLAAAFTTKGKENRESSVKPPPKTVPIKDEAMRVRTYGKPEYQRGRTTIRDPYLHFKNPKKGVAAKSSVTNLNESARSRDGRQRTPPGAQYQEPVVDHMPRQFYFSPSRGYVALAAGDTAPIQGQLVSMAIPLGAPRLEPGVRRSAAPVTRCTSNPVSSTPVTAARNVAMVSFPVGGAGEYARQPELAKQVLPPIDIDSISPSSSQRSDIHIRSPQQDHTNATFMFDTQNEEGEEEDSDLNKTLTEENSDLEQSGEGIKLPGYDPKTAEHFGPSFPPRFNKPGPEWAGMGGQSKPAQNISNVMAEDLRRRDLLENNAISWLEQELMARILSQVPHHEAQEVADSSKAASEEGSDWNESLLVADVIGQGGMQLFINAGQPVNNALVQELVKEVIREKVMTLMSQRIAEGEGQSHQAGGRNEVEEVIEERQREKAAADNYRVPTPELTPRTSPIPFPQQPRVQPPQPVTPPQSPPADSYRFRNIEPEPQVLPEPVKQPQPVAQPPMPLQLAESDSEVSLSLDISEELRRVAANNKSRDLDGQVVACYDVATPPGTPSPVVEEELSQAFSDRRPTPSFTPPAIKTPSRSQTPVLRQQEPVSQHEEQEELLEQPQPIMMSVGVGDSRPMTAETQTQHRSPSPKRPLTPVSTSETSSSSVESSSTETVNEFISEGQWLLSYSEGQVVGAVNIEAIRKEIAGKGYQHIIDVSTASTLRDTEDLDLDAEGAKSEGEFIFGGVPDPDKDPRLEVLAGLLKKPARVNQILIGPAPTEVMSSTGRSVGEMSIGQVAPSKVAMDRARRFGQTGSEGNAPARMESSIEEDYRRKMERQERRYDVGTQQKSRSQSSLLETHSRSPSPQRQQRSRTPPQHGQHGRTQSPLEGQHSRTQSPLEGTQPPLKGSRSRTPSPQQQQVAKTLSRQSQQQMAPPQRQSVFETRTRAQMQYQPVPSEGRPLSSRGRNVPGQRGSRRGSDSRLSQSSDPGMRRSGSISQHESLSRSADGEMFGRSGNGFLTSSLKSRQSSFKKSVEFDLSGTERSSRRAPRDSLENGADTNSFIGLTYTEASLDESELRRMSGGASPQNLGPYRMSVTIPSAADGEDSELSEFDISNRS